MKHGPKWDALSLSPVHDRNVHQANWRIDRWKESLALSLFNSISLSLSYTHSGGYCFLLSLSVVLNPSNSNWKYNELKRCAHRTKLNESRQIKSQYGKIEMWHTFLEGIFALLFENQMWKNWKQKKKQRKKNLVKIETRLFFQLCIAHRP